MKIGLTGSSLNNKDNLSGSATPIVGLINELVRSGHDVVWFERNPVDEVADFSPVPAYQANVENLKNLSRKLELDLVIIQTWSFSPELIAKFFKKQGAKVYYWDDNTPFAMERLLPTEPYVDKYLTHGDGAADILVQSGIPHKKIEIFYFATDPERFKPKPTAKFGSDVVFVGTNLKERNANLKQVFFQPSKILKDKSFHLYGSGWDAWEELSRFPVEYRGWISNRDLSKVFSSATIVVNATRSVFTDIKLVPSNRIFDVMACGSVFLTDPIPGIQELFKPGEDLLVAESTSEAIDKMRYVFNNPTKAAMIGENGRETVLCNHTWKQRVRQLGLDQKD